MLKQSAVACVLLLLSSAARADVVATVSTVEQDYANLDYASAREGSQTLLKRGHLTHDETIRAVRVHALSAAAMDQHEEAKNAFVLLLALDPSFTVDARLGPRFREPFNEAKGYWSGQHAKAGVEASVSVHAKGASSARVITRDPTGLAAKVTFRYRWAPARSYQQVLVKSADAQLDVPEPPSGSTRLEYFVQAEDKAGNLVFERGALGSPLSATVPALAQGRIVDEKRSVFASPWFWVATVLVAGGAATTAVVLGTRGGNDAGPGTVQWTPSLRCGTEGCQ